MKFKDIRVMKRLRTEDTYLHIGIITGVLAYSTPLVVGLFTGKALAWVCLFFTVACVTTGVLMKNYEVKL